MIAKYLSHFHMEATKKARFELIFTRDEKIVCFFLLTETLFVMLNEYNEKYSSKQS